MLPSYGEGPGMAQLKCEGAPYFGEKGYDEYVELCLDELQKLWDAQAMASEPAGFSRGEFITGPDLINLGALVKSTK